MTFLPDDIVRDTTTGRTATLAMPTTLEHQWWALPQGEYAHERWTDDQFVLIERPYPGGYAHAMADVSLDERQLAPVWGWVFLYVGVAALALLAWLGAYLAGLL